MAGPGRHRHRGRSRLLHQQLRRHCRSPQAGRLSGPSAQTQHEAAILQEYQRLKGTRAERSFEEIAIEKCGFYLKDFARYDYLLKLPEKEDISKAIRRALASIENAKPELLGVLPDEEYDRFVRSPKNRHIPKDLLKLFSDNQRRIALLESMAEEIYREWFVRMRFPGAKSAVFDKGVPTDWTHEPILDAFKFYGGATPAKDNPRFWVDGEVHWYTPTDITGASSPYLEESADKCTDEGLQNCSANLFPAYSIMMTSRATIGAIGINCAPACTNQGFITCIPNQRYPLIYLYHWLKLAKPHFEMLSGGATFAELTKGTFKRIRILTPPEKLVAAYEQQARPMFDQVESLTKMNRTLRATRDALLPRLISGKLRVDALDIQFPPSMQPPTEAAQRGEAKAS
nr:restriction endonuclease subunit S [Pseudacidovorax sp. NFM-22]